MVRRRGRWPWITHIHSTTRTIPEYSMSSATPTGRYRTALKNETWAPATASNPNRPTVPAARRATCQRPRSAMSAGTARTSAAIPMRAATAASADHPASMRERAKMPDVPNVAADSSARPRPVAAVRSTRMVSSSE
jgi:hypothetical protein